MPEYIKKEELKEIQLDILKSIHEFCQVNNISYSLACGTLLGAIRHKGFIPWDDDIDICLLRDDYAKLEEKWPDLLKGKYKFYTLKTSKEWNRPYGKICDSRTVVEEAVNSNIGIGIGIDVFPMDEVPRSTWAYKNWNLVRTFLMSIWIIKQLVWRKRRQRIKNLLILLFRSIFFFLNLRKLAVFMDIILRQNEGCNSGLVVEGCDLISIPGIINKTAFDNFIDVDFEQYQFKALKDYDHYLKKMYGDYMQLPPIEKRVSNHSFVAYWKK